MKTSANLFNRACEGILGAHPQSIGVAYKILDCGCALICGVSGRGEPVGYLQHVSGQPPDSGGSPPECLSCRRNAGLERVVWEGIYWPQDTARLPDKAYRIAIGRKVFGPGYIEAD
jgi:hypothetical protein